jgi:hypothetical protein
VIAFWESARPDLGGIRQLLASEFGRGCRV